ncbi:hypothetical protein GCM10011452_18580 [Gemmobacter lanyuensis]|uniref:Tyr recombinase domain-containing protein n=1 Tax=Gemmobacter lanyuensis TaxID=1054497 RepID=A0A918IU89_9RHOB|nr:hypothetical protein GCM10011452_18580 [Gemmobacter lanyuensis]
MDKGALAMAPWAGYRIDKPKEKVADRKAQKVAGFTPAEVKAILAHVAATAHADTADHWLPMLSAYSGARREELGQLRVEDVMTSGNIPALRITDEGEDQKVNNAHSLRTIPVPLACIERGFLEFVPRRRQAGRTTIPSSLCRGYIWSEREDSNLRPPAPEAMACPLYRALEHWRFTKEVLVFSFII